MSTSTKGSAAVAPRPRIWWTESALGEALARLGAVDPGEEMTESEAAEFLAQFVNPKAVVARRDEFAEFLLQADTLALAKRAHAAEIVKQAAAIEGGAERMRAQAVKLMQAANVRALEGSLYTMKLKDSRGRVDVTDEMAIPPEFWRVRQDEDLARLTWLTVTVEALVRAAIASEGLEGEALTAAADADEVVRTARQHLADATAERRAVDKTAIQAEWKANGETRSEVDPETGEVLTLPMVAGARKLVDTKLVVE